MENKFKLFEPPEAGDDEEARKKLKELCDMMVNEAARRESLLACDLEEERWLGRNESIFH